MARSKFVERKLAIVANPGVIPGIAGDHLAMAA